MLNESSFDTVQARPKDCTCGLKVEENPKSAVWMKKPLKGKAKNKTGKNQRKRARNRLVREDKLSSPQEQEENDKLFSEELQKADTIRIQVYYGSTSEETPEQIAEVEEGILEFKYILVHYIRIFLHQSLSYSIMGHMTRTGAATHGKKYVRANGMKFFTLVPFEARSDL